MIILALLALGYAAVGGAVYFNQRSLIFFPTHDSGGSGLSPWVVDGRVMGYCRAVEAPRTVWLMTHGNAGQASQRGYVLARVAPGDSLYVLEYPGYGSRPGHPSRDSMDEAAAEAYRELRREFPRTPVGVIGESIGSGPASFLASASPRPDKIVLVVPFDTFGRVAAEHMRFLPVGLLLKDDWDNIAALKGYLGPVAIYAARDDRIIPPGHARLLAASDPRATFTLIEGGHNEWSESESVRIER
jgi:uncharacterized protein